MKWITRERPKIDRLACPWLIRRFIDASVEFIFVPAAEVKAKARELRETIQDQIDTNLSLSQKEVAEGLNVHPAYLSREFSKSFDNLSFGEYIRKLRIEKALQLLHQPEHSLSEIDYLTGFSDQSHFTRIFKKHTGQNPSDYRKSLAKGKTNHKG